MNAGVNKLPSHIMFVGKMAAGKTVLANYLQGHWGYKKLSLADPIKKIEQTLANGHIPATATALHMAHLNEKEKKIFIKILEEALLIPREEPKPRKRLQFIGTDGGRKRISDMIWVEYLNRVARDCNKVVIDDVRFKNEYQFFKNTGYFPIAICVSPETQMKRLESLYGEVDPVILEHPSETEIDRILKEDSLPLTIDTSETTTAEAILLLKDF